jgi:hypothetical protein
MRYRGQRPKIGAPPSSPSLTGPPAASQSRDPVTKMVVTLRSGVQITVDVEKFSTGGSPVGGHLRQLKWTQPENPEVELNWVDLAEVAAVHAEHRRPLEIIPVQPKTILRGKRP